MAFIPRLPTFGKVPDYDPDFNPKGIWMMRPVWWRQACSHVLCGDPRSGKTTFIHSGMHELATANIYDANDLRTYPAVRKTRRISRFSLERNGSMPMIDSWIDVDGERFLESFGLNGTDKENLKSLEKVYSRVNSMVMLLPAQRLLDLYRHLHGENKKAAEAASDYIDGMVRRINALKPHSVRKIARAGFRWHLLVSQCGDVLKRPDDLVTLATALGHFADKTGLRATCRRAILLDSLPSPLVKKGLGVAKLQSGPRGGLGINGNPEAVMCSAGVAMAIILNRLKASHLRHSFIHPL